MNTDLRPIFARGQSRAIMMAIAGLAGLAGCWFFFGEARIAQAYLYSFFFWFGLSAGGLGLLLLHHVVAGAWGFMIQRILEAASRTLPIMALLFIPVAVYWLPTLYPWHPDNLDGGHHADEAHAAAEAGHGDDHGDHGGHDAIVAEFVEKKALYLDVEGWQYRAIGFFAVWLFLMWFLNSGSRKLDRTGDEAVIPRLRAMSAVGIVLFVLTMTFAATDWAMTLEPVFYSSMYGPIFFVSQALSILAFAIIVLAAVKNYKPISDVYNLEIVHHLGNLLLAFTVLWAYTNFSQFLIIWSGNLVEEIPFYLNRTSNTPLVAVSLFIMAFHFFVPFFILLWRRNKRAIGALTKIAWWMLAMRVVDLYWYITPSFAADELRWPVPEIFALLFLGGLWLMAFFKTIQRQPLLPEKDPRQVEAFTKWESSHEHA